MSITEYRRWFAYEQESHAAVIGCLKAIPAEKHAEPEFKKAVGLMAHIAAARRLWLYRFGVNADPPTEFFPAISLDEAAKRLEAAHKLWVDYLEGIGDTELDSIFEYNALDGGRFRNSVRDILTQLHGHSLYHRGQVALLVRLLGEQPVQTDFVYWAREAL